MRASRRAEGFSLIELVAGIVVFSIAMVIVINLVVNQTRQSIDPILQSRAAGLAKSLASEIMAKAFDENTALDGGNVRCGEAGVLCTLPANLGAEELREDFDDVDDYNGLVAANGSEIANLLGQPITDGVTNLYEGYSLSIEVMYDNNFDGIADGVGLSKLVLLTINTPSLDQLQFAFYRMNY